MYFYDVEDIVEKDTICGLTYLEVSELIGIHRNCITAYVKQGLLFNRQYKVYKSNVKYDDKKIKNDWEEVMKAANLLRNEDGRIVSKNGVRCVVMNEEET